MMSRDDATTRRPRGPEAAAGEVWSADLERPHQHSSQGVPTFFSPAASFGAPQNPDARTRRFWIWISFGESRGPTRSGENQNHTADIFISPRKIESDGGGRGASLRRRQDTTALRELAGKDEHHLRWKRSVRDRALERQAPFLLACAIRHDALGGSVELPKGKHSGRPRVGQRAREFHDGLPGCAAIPRSQRLRVFRGHGAREEPDDVALPRGGGEAEKGESFSFPPTWLPSRPEKKNAVVAPTQLGLLETSFDGLSRLIRARFITLYDSRVSLFPTRSGRGSVRRRAHAEPHEEVSGRGV